MDASDHNTVDLDGDELTSAQADDGFNAVIVAAKEALAGGDNATARRILDELEARQQELRDALGGNAAGEPSTDRTLSLDEPELQPGLRSAEAVNQEMERVRARREAREQVVGEPAVLVSTTGGPLRRRDKYGNVGPPPPSRERERLAAEFERFSRLSPPEQRRYQALGAVREQRSTCTAPPARPRESRTGARRAAHRGATRAGPGDDDSESEGEPAGVSPHACRRKIAGARP